MMNPLIELVDWDTYVHTHHHIDDIPDTTYYTYKKHDTTYTRYYTSYHIYYVLDTLSYILSTDHRFRCIIQYVLYHSMYTVHSIRYVTHYIVYNMYCIISAI